ncbi:MAG: Bax inhibitor-1 family protein [Acidobacteriota bacterium]
MPSISAASPSAARPVASIDTERRAAFIVQTYLHLLGAILGFVAIEVALFQTGLAREIAAILTGTSWLLVLGAFLVVSWLASSVALRARSKAAQYAALAGFVVAEALIFVPLLFAVNLRVDGGIQSAALVTLFGFCGLTWIAFVTRRDFSFLGGIVRWGMVSALILIVAALLFGFRLGTYFSVAMIALAGAAILYDTSNVLRRFPRDRFVGAALHLFASVALMFWYVLRLVRSRH